MRTRTRDDFVLLRSIRPFSLAGMVAESRAAFIREACKQRLKSLETKELDHRYVEGYRKKPEELDWAEASARLLSKLLRPYHFA